jgi:predicted dienelactone hydrolase
MTMALRFDRRNFLAGAGGALMLGACAATMPGARASFARRQFVLEAADGRNIAVSEWLPSGQVAGHLVFSHGWGGSPDGCLRIIEPMVAAGWHVLAPLHTDSEVHPDKARYQQADSWPNRVNDMRAVSRHLGDASYVAAGHSYGALTALVMGGVETTIPPGIDAPLRDEKAVAAIAFSPPLSLPDFVDREGWSKLAVPALIQTGTLDNPSFEGVSDETWEGRLVSYEAASPGHDRYAMVLEGVDHNFGGAIGSRLATPDPLQDRQLDAAVAIAALFARAHGLRDRQAQAELAGRLSDTYPLRLMRK